MESTFPYQLLKASTPVCEDIRELASGVDYVACWGKSRALGRLADLPALSVLWISNVNPKQLSALPSLPELRTLIVYDLKTTDLACLEKFPSLETLLVWGNTKATTFAGVEGLNSLAVLGLEHFPKVNDYSPLASLGRLVLLSLSGDMYTALRPDTLAPLAFLHNLEFLSLTQIRVGDESLAFVEQLDSLGELVLSNQFPTKEYARLSANRPDVKCSHFAPYIEGPLSCEICGASQVMVVGKRKPFLCPKCVPERLKKYVNAFDVLAAEQLNNRHERTP